MTAPWPQYDAAHVFPDDEATMDAIMEAIRAIRNRRSEMNVPPSKKAHVYIATDKPAIFEQATLFFQRLASASEVFVGESFDIPGAVCIVTADAKVYIPMGDLVDLDAERKRLTKEKDAAEKKLAGIRAKLSNPGFLAKAPAAVIDTQKAEEAKTLEKLRMIDESLAAFGA